MRHDRSLVSAFTLSLIAVLVLPALLAGCAGFKLPGSNADRIVAFAGATGLGCKAIPAKDRATAKAAVSCAGAVFGETFSPEQVAVCAAAANVPAEYQVLVGLLIGEVKAAVGGGAILKPDSTEAKAVTEFLRVCDAALS